MRSYPYKHWPRVQKRQVAVLRRIARLIPIADLESIVQTLTGLLGSPVALAPGVADSCTAQERDALLVSPTAALLLLPVGSGIGAPLVLEIDPSLARHIATLALGALPSTGDPHVFPAPMPLSEIEQGVLAFVAASVLSARQPGWQVAGVLGTPEALRSALGSADAAVWPAGVRLGSGQGTMRLWVPARACSLLSNSPGPAMSEFVRHLTMPLQVDVAWGTLSSSDYRDLEPGAVIVLDRSLVRPAEHGWTGQAEVCITEARRTRWRCDVEPKALRLVEVIRSGEPAQNQGKIMTKNTTTQAYEPVTQVDTAVNLAGDAPIELAVEVARFTLALEELARIQPGEILATGKAVGDRVTLRANGRAVAVGELVDIEGEVGFRVIELPQHR